MVPRDNQIQVEHGGAIHQSECSFRVRNSQGLRVEKRFCRPGTPCRAVRNPKPFNKSRPGSYLTSVAQHSENKLLMLPNDIPSFGREIPHSHAARETASACAILLEARRVVRLSRAKGRVEHNEQRSQSTKLHRSASRIASVKPKWLPACVPRT